MKYVCVGLAANERCRSSTITRTPGTSAAWTRTIRMSLQDSLARLLGESNSALLAIQILISRSVVM